MKRYAFVPALVLFLSGILIGTAGAQSKPATSNPVPPAAAPQGPRKFVPPVKGVATVEVMRVGSKKVGKDIVTTLKIKNTSSGSINLLKIDELWYDKKRTMVTTGTYRHKQPFAPGEVIEVEVHSPLLGQPDISQMTFGHANGKVEAKTVKKLE